MNPDLLVALMNNAAILLVLGLIYQMGSSARRKSVAARPIIDGILIGLIGLVLMSTAYELQPGIVYDTRSILISITALMFGPLTTAVTVLILAAYRIISGGAGVLPGIAVIISSAVLGSIWRKYVFDWTRNNLRWLNLYLLGCAVHVVMLACMLLLPWPQSAELIREIAFPVLVIYPLVTVLLGLVLLQQKDHRSARIELEESEKLFRDVVSGAPDAILIIIRGEICFANRSALGLLGAENETQIIGHQMLDHVYRGNHTKEYNRFRDTETGSKESSLSADEEIYLRLDGSPIHVEVSSVPIVYRRERGIMIFARDITRRKLLENERRETEAQLRQQQKLEAIGTLAGGVAHEINNPLNGIMNLAQLILDDSGEDPPHREYLDQIIRETKRISVIVKNLLRFSRQDIRTQSLARIEDIINQTVTLLGAVFKKDQIDIEVYLADNLPSLRCRSQQIQQVLMNLLTNSRDALNDKFPGYDKHKKIMIHAGSFMTENKSWIRISVRDYGIGIPEPVQQKIFEPFFSTKSKDKGTGLGLAISFGIIRDHNGTMTIDSQEGEFTRVIVDLPVEGNIGKPDTD